MSSWEAAQKIAVLEPDILPSSARKIEEAKVSNALLDAKPMAFTHIREEASLYTSVLNFTSECLLCCSLHILRAHGRLR